MKSTNLEEFKDFMSKSLYGMSRTEALEKGICVSCKEAPGHLTVEDEAEYKISALCSKCYEVAVLNAG